ncbi:MAG: Ig-like domain-containing protein [Candidatus Thorarchaeota archaeon]
MNRRSPILIIIALTLVLGVSGIIGTLPMSLMAEQMSKPFVLEEQVMPASNSGELGPIVQNVNRNPGMEKADFRGAPDTYGYYGSAYMSSDLAYQDLTHSGSYAGRIEDRGETGQAYAYVGQYIGNPPYAYLDEDISLDAYFYLENAPDLGRGGYSYLWISTFDGGVYYDIFYVFSYGTYSNTNSSNQVWYFMNHTIGTWHNFVRNVTQDFVDYFGVPSGFRYVGEVYFYVISPSWSTEVSAMNIDDISVTNGTSYEYMYNTGFEDGAGGSWNTYQESLGFLSLSTDATEGSYSANMSIAAIDASAPGYMYLYRSWSYPSGVYPTNPIVVSFDWKYSNSIVGDSDLFARLRLRCRNDTGSYYVYYYLGIYNDDISMFSNSTNYFYIQSSQLGARDTWQHEAIDVRSITQIAGFDSDIVIYDVRFEVRIGYLDATQVELLVDDFNIITYPTLDPGFEEDWRDSSYQLTSWQMWSGELGVVSRTTDSHSGVYALNLTIQNNDGAGVAMTNVHLKIDPDLFTDFWWRLDNFTAINGYAYIQFYIEGGYSLRYYFAHATSLPSNSSYSVYYALDDMNTVGSWFNLRRNLVDDLNTAFGDHQWNVTQYVIDAYAGSSSKISIIFDEIHFRDGGLPVVLNVQRQTAIPVYYEPVDIGVNAIDTLSGVYSVGVYYDAGLGWQRVDAVWMTDDYYEAEIPIQVYDTTVDFYVNVTDYGGTSAIDDNGGSLYSYTIGDDINPTVTLTEPDESEVISGDILFQATADDVGSSIDYVDFYVDAALVSTDDTAPFEFVWDSRTVSNGTHTVIAEAFDIAGNSLTDSAGIDVQNDVASPTLSMVLLSPSVPEIDDIVRVAVAVDDATGIDNVTLSYRIDGGMWNLLVMTPSAGLYYADIPATGVVATVEYFILAWDVFGQPSFAGTDIAPLSYDTIDSSGLSYPPDISAAIITPMAPGYGDVVTVSVAVTDESGIDSVTLYYRLDGGTWISESMSLTGSLYHGDIPGHDYGTVVDFYIEATNLLAQTSSEGTASEPLSYTVGDYIAPTLVVNGPDDGSIITGVVLIDATGIDPGSGCNNLILVVDGVVEEESLTDEYGFNWDTRELENGEHSVRIQAVDGAGNIAEIELTYNIQNPVGFEVVSFALGDFLANYGFFVGVGVAAALWFGISYLMKRRTASKST